jgi:hypothetical protein
MAQNELQAHCEMDHESAQWLSDVRIFDLDLVDEISKLRPSDPLRLAVLNPKNLSKSLNRSGDIHLSVSKQFKCVLDIALIQRSLASVLPVTAGDSIPLRGLFKKITRKTTVIARTPEEEVEYQYFHRQAAQ